MSYLQRLQPLWSPVDFKNNAHKFANHNIISPSFASALENCDDDFHFNDKCMRYTNGMRIVTDVQLQQLRESYRQKISRLARKAERAKVSRRNKTQKAKDMCIENKKLKERITELELQIQGNQTMNGDTIDSNAQHSPFLLYARILKTIENVFNVHNDDRNIELNETQKERLKHEVNVFHQHIKHILNEEQWKLYKKNFV